MLPFLKPKNMATTIIAGRKKDGSLEDSHEEGKSPGPLVSAAEDLIKAINSKDAEAVGMALQAAHDICGSMPNMDESIEEEIV